MARREPPADAAPRRDPDTPNPVEIAMAAINDGAPADGPAGVLLRRHTRLIDAQIASERMGFLLKLLTALVGVAFAVAFGTLAWAASQERGLVIEPFSVPPELAERGITGQVLASQLLDRLSVITEQTQSVREPSTYANNWNGDIKVQIPQTGVSVGELRRILVEWLGRQTRIGGELYRDSDGFVLAARTGTAAATVHEGKSAADLDAMVQSAAESVYASTQPYRYAIHVSAHPSLGGRERAAELLRQLARDGDPADQVWSHSGLSVLANSTGELEESIGEATAALQIEPRFAIARLNRATAYSLLGHDEMMLQDLREGLGALESDGSRFLVEDGIEQVRHVTTALHAYKRGDFPTSRANLEALAGQEVLLATVRLAQHDVLLEPRLFERMLASGPVTWPDTATYASSVAQVAALHAWEREDWVAAQRFVADFDERMLTPAGRRIRAAVERPLEARAAARAGEMDAARAVVAALPQDCYECTWTRGFVAAAAGEHAAADRAFARATEQAPSLPQAHHHWGDARLARGDEAGAIEQFRLAHRKAPAWADPLKGWGDALMQQGDVSGALERYAAAADRAPHWGKLRLAWAVALHRAGDAAAAREQLVTAAGLGLSPVDGERLRSMLQ